MNFVCIYKNRIMISAEIFLSREGGGMKENDGGGESN
jgi:hypothetical protein